MGIMINTVGVIMGTIMGIITLCIACTKCGCVLHTGAHYTQQNAVILLLQISCKVKEIGKDHG